jgi:hypothetical protein
VAGPRARWLRGSGHHGNIRLHPSAHPQGYGLGCGASAGSDVGNDRPQVSFDGLMVRRRLVIAIRPTEGADFGFVEKEMDRAARRLHLTLSTMSASVLDPAILENLAPELVLAFPAGTTPTVARRLVDPAPGQPRRVPSVAAYQVSPVLVHDLRFTADSANPAALAGAIAREGILSDALGNYGTTLGRHELEITYTGPLLSDDLVESVRGGIARRAGIQPAGVTVAPRTTTGVGVDMTKEPTPAPAIAEISTAHNHGTVLKEVVDSSQSGAWVVYVVALAGMLIQALVLLQLRRFNKATD